MNRRIDTIARPGIPLITLMLLLVGSTARGGAIKGMVMSMADRERLAGVNVVVRGTLRGASTDSWGEFLVADIPTGTYAVVFSIVGYQRETVDKVEVAEGQTVELVVRLTPVPIQTEAVVVSASKREQSILEVPVSVSVLDASGIAYRNLMTVDEALRYIPGVNMTEFQVNVRGSSGYSRGVGSRVLLLVDGIPLLTGDTGELNYETIPINLVERIEVVKGASSALYGSNALGGVINVITRAVAEKGETRVRCYGGLYGGPSHSQWEWGGGTRSLNGQSLSHSQRFNDLGLMLFACRQQDDGYRQNDFKRRYNGFLRLKYDISSFQTLGVTFNVLNQKRGSFLYWKDLAYALVPPDDQQDDIVESTRFFLSGIYNHIISNTLLYSVKGMWFRNKFWDNVSTSGDNSLSDVVRSEVQATWLASAIQTLTLGVEGNIEKVDADLFGKRSGSGAAVYAQDEILVMEQVRATLGARFDFQNVDSLESSSQLNPKMGLSYTPKLGTTVRASFGMGFRTPSVAEAFVRTQVSGLVIEPNPNLKPERSYSYELGLSQMLGDAALIDVAVFQNEFKNLIESGFNPAGNGQFNNVTKARIQGVEVSAKVGLFNKTLFLESGYTYVYPKDRTKDDILKYRPRHLLYISALVRAGVASFGADFRYVSRIERIDEEFVRLGIVKDGDQRVATYVTDIQAGADFSIIGVSIIANLNVKNVLQYNYVELIGNLAPPRTVVLSLEARI